MTSPAEAHGYQADALRGIAAAAVLARQRVGSLLALQSFLADVEHHLSTLIVLDAIPTDTGRPITVSGLDLGAPVARAVEAPGHLCRHCRAGNHLHDTYPDGRPADCPYQGIDGDPDTACSCPYRGPEVRRQL